MARKPAFISHSSEREAEIQSRLLDVLEGRFRRRISEVIASEAQDLTKAYRDLGYVPAVSDQSVADVREVYRALAIASARTFGQRILTQGKAKGFQIETKQEGGFLEFFRSVASLWLNLEAVRRRIRSVTETTRNQIIAAVAQGQEEGLGVEAIAAEIERRTAQIARVRGRLIARTETHGAANFAMHRTAQETRLNLEKEWVSVEDMRTRAIIRDDEFDHVSMNGQRVAMDEPFLMPWRNGPSLPIMYPGEAGLPGGATINCLPPWSNVRLAGIKRVMRCEYVGDLFQFSFAGPVDFTVTANHPVLTLSGWKAARHVVEGDDLIYNFFGDSFPSGINANVKNRHARVDELYNTLKSLGNIVRADLGAVNFHGDMPNSDVNIVTAHGQLRDAMIAEGHHLFGDISLADTHIAKGLLLARRMIGLRDSAAAYFPDGGMGGFGAGNASVWAGHSGLSAIAFADIRSLDAKVIEATVNHAARNIEGLGNSIGAISSIKHALHFGKQALTDDAPSGVLRSFKPVKVTAIKRFHYDGPVYNCETDTGLIVSDGVVNHNCRCAVVHHVMGGLLGD